MVPREPHMESWADNVGDSAETADKEWRAAMFLTSRRKRTMCLVSLGLASGTLLVPASTALAAPADTHFVVVNDPQTFTATAFCLPEDKLGTVVTQETSSGNERRDKQWRRRGDR